MLIISSFLKGIGNRKVTLNIDLSQHQKKRKENNYNFKDLPGVCGASDDNLDQMALGKGL